MSAEKMSRKEQAALAGLITRFLDAWLGARQIIQAANFNRFQKAGLSATQFMTLNLIPVGPTMTLSELAARMNLSTATVARTIDSLEERELLTRTRSVGDRREVLLALTGEGRTLQNAASEEFHRHMTSLFLKMEGEPREGLVRGLEALVGAAGATQTDDAARAKRSSQRSLKR